MVLTGLIQTSPFFPRNKAYIFTLRTYSNNELNIFKKGRKMDTIDRDILKAIFTEKESIYRAEKDDIEGSSYSTVWRHIQKMEKDNLITFVEAYRKNGEIDKRKKKGKPKLTNKGIATLLIDGDLKKEELLSVGKKIFLTYLGQNIFLIIQPLFTEIFSDALVSIKPKVNLKYFNEEYFVELLVKSFVESSIENLAKSNLKIDQKDLQKLFAASRKVAQKERADEYFKMGLNFGKSLKSTKEKGE